MKSPLPAAKRLILLLILVGGGAALAQPAQVILLRHAEKPDDPAAVHLSARGVERARALVSLLGKGSTLTSNAPVAALYATHVTKHDHSHRTAETLAPLARDLGLPVQTPYESKLYGQLARSLLTNRAYKGKTVVVCWVHHDIAALAAALGAEPPPPPWKDKTFDRLWILKPGLQGGGLEDLPQHLLKGDSRR